MKARAPGDTLVDVAANDNRTQVPDTTIPTTPMSCLQGPSLSSKGSSRLARFVADDLLDPYSVSPSRAPSEKERRHLREICDALNRTLVIGEPYLWERLDAARRALLDSEAVARGRGNSALGTLEFLLRFAFIAKLEPEMHDSIRDKMASHWASVALIDERFRTLDFGLVVWGVIVRAAREDDGKRGGAGNVGAFRVLADLALRCGAFDAVIKPGETRHHALNRVAKKITNMHRRKGLRAL